MSWTSNFAVVLSIVLAAPAARAQLRVSPEHKLSWSENAGRMNWLDAANGTSSVRVHPTFLSGMIWMENIGWVVVGDGSPANGLSYTNLSGTDFGVNHSAANGALSGFAWSENAGWLNFGGGSLATPAKPARISAVSPRRFFGYVWSENLGWINLDDSGQYIQLNTCPADLNGDNQVDDSDFVLFALAYDVLDCLDPAMSVGCAADLDNDAMVGDPDFVLFAQAYDALTCP